MINKCIFVGRVGKDPTINYMQNGTLVANFSLAVSESWKDKAGNKQERTEWIRCIAFRKLAEIIGEYVKKGALLYCEGKMQTREWEKDGVKRYVTEIIVNEMKMLGGKHKSDEPENNNKPEAYKQPEPRDESMSEDFDIPF